MDKKEEILSSGEDELDFNEINRSKNIKPPEKLLVTLIIFLPYNNIKE